MLIGSKQNVRNTDLKVSIAGSSVVKVHNIVIIDESLSWGPHVEYVKKTVSSNLGMLTRIRKDRNYVPQSSLHWIFVCFTPLTQIRETTQSTHMALSISFAKKEFLRHEFCCEW